MRSAIKLASGAELSYLAVGEPSNPAILLIHGFPSSARTFRDIVAPLAKIARVIAPDLPGFGASDPLPSASFPHFAEAVGELLDHLSIGPRYIYLHDFGAPVGLEIAMRKPELVSGLIIQNANAHESGFGDAWSDTKAFWCDPTPDNEAKATAHLTAEGTRDQYVANVPHDIAQKISPAVWEEDWRVMQLPGRMATQHALVADYGRYVARFGEIADYFARHQPPALLLWGRHDSFFDLAETVSWMEALPRMEAHILDGGHLLLETHAPAAAALMLDFIARTEGGGSRP